MFTVEQIEAPAIDQYRADLVTLLTDAVNGGASVNFVAPLDPAIAQSFWDKIRTDLLNNSRVVLAAFAEDQGVRSIIGCVHLAIAMPPNGLHRAEIQKLLVHSHYRNQGIGGALMRAADDSARRLGKSLLVLDTEAHSTADSLYGRWGFTRAGTIPQFALDSTGTKLIDTVLYYKLL
jgi:GNAT superfamily N-acetyltransferase